MGTGGMRCGAGRPGWKVKAEHCRQIDVRRWQREGMLAPGRAGGWAWRDADTGRQTASIGYRSEAGAVVLDYTLNGEPIQQRVLIEHTVCNYGGARAWFGCPRCGRRVAVLYLRNNGFACRRCQLVAYGSQSDDEMSRTWRKQRKVEAKLSADLQRPAGMHWTTYERLLDVVEDCQHRRNNALAGYLDKVMPDWRLR